MQKFSNVPEVKTFQNLLDRIEETKKCLEADGVSFDEAPWQVIYSVPSQPITEADRQWALEQAAKGAR